MTHPKFYRFVFVGMVCFSTTLSAESHEVRPGESGIAYGNAACNSGAEQLTETDVQCTAVFSDTNVWDFLNNLPQRITLEELITLNPALGPVNYETIIGGLTFVRVQ